MRIGRIGAWTGAALGMVGMAGAAQAMTATNPGALDLVTVNAACTPIIASFTTNTTFTFTQVDGAGVDNAVIAAYDGAGVLLRYFTVATDTATTVTAATNFTLNTAVAAATALPLQVRIVDVTGLVTAGSVNAGTVLHTFTVPDGLITGEDLAGCNALRRAATTNPTQASSTGVISGVTRIQQDLMVGNTQRHLDNILQVQFGGGFNTAGAGGSTGSGNSTANPFAAAMSGLMYGQTGPAQGGAAGFGFGTLSGGARDERDWGWHNFGEDEDDVSGPRRVRDLKDLSLADRATQRQLAGLLGFSTAATPRVNPQQQAAAMALTPDSGSAGKAPGARPEDLQATRVPQRPNNIWLYGAYSDMENRRNIGGDDRRFSGDSIAFTGGTDHRFDDGMLGGVVGGMSLSYITTDLLTTFNTGRYRDNTYALAPYFLITPTDWFSVNGTAGFAYSKISQYRNGGTVTSDTRSDALFASVTATARYLTASPLHLLARTTLSGSRRWTDGFIESDGTVVGDAVSTVATLRPGSEVGWNFTMAPGTVLQPFGQLAYAWDIGESTNNDNGAWETGGGVRLMNAASGLGGQIGYLTKLGLDDYDEQIVQGVVTYGFDSLFGDDAAAGKGASPSGSMVALRASQSELGMTMVGIGLSADCPTPLGHGMASLDFDRATATSGDSEAYGMVLAGIRIALDPGRRPAGSGKSGGSALR